jgi:hypothetical protein
LGVLPAVLLGLAQEGSLGLWFAGYVQKNAETPFVRDLAVMLQRSVAEASAHLALVDRLLAALTPALRKALRERTPITEEFVQRIMAEQQAVDLSDTDDEARRGLAHMVLEATLAEARDMLK